MPEKPQEDQFAAAATRHFRDADYLHKGSRLPSADHLYGFAAECAVKSLLLRFTEVTMGSPKPEAPHPDDPDRTIEFGHVNELVREVKVLARGRSGPALSTALDGDLRAFRRWRVHHRYSDGTYAQTEVVDKRRDAAHRILALHEQAVLNGRLA
ncbi:hypothetical protein [Streptomyces sp. AC555_RSS877]|uniref:hypothetical protein n=1 Tax=Streptomyces sp. AC555_RSS877 TaxID=2823688 RepID=UPI001C266221|nr:hypothetical protein [Streptomyces sp. AC555_RSS877]